MVEEYRLPEGMLLVERKGPWAMITVKTAKKGLYRAYLLGKRGHFDLGLLLPMEDQLILERRLSVQRLEEAGSWPILGGRLSQSIPPAPSLPKVLPGWVNTCPQGLFPHDILLQELFQTPPPFYRQSQGFSFAYPWKPNVPFPCPPLFCFGQVQELMGQLWLVFHFTPEGRPFLQLPL